MKGYPLYEIPFKSKEVICNNCGEKRKTIDDSFRIKCFKCGGDIKDE